MEFVVCMPRVLDGMMPRALKAAKVVLCILRVSESLDAASAGPHAIPVLDSCDAMPREIELVLYMLPVLEGILLLEGVDVVLRSLKPVLGVHVLDIVPSMLCHGQYARIL